jgi:RimJ/RimL family protein N-acetyltransferase
MTTIQHIPQNQRRQQLALINQVAEAVYDSDDQKAFINAYVPRWAQAPNAAVLANYFNAGCSYLWAVLEDEKPVAFILINRNPIGHGQNPNSVGFGINREYDGQGIMTRAFQLIERQHGPGSAYPLQYPLWAYTSQRNLASHRLLEKCGFERTDQAIDFHGEPSFEYVKREWTNWVEVE